MLRRDGYKCQVRLEGVCTGEATEVDHVRAIALWGVTFDPTHLRATCGPCNRALGGQVSALQYRISSAAAAVGPSRVW